MNRDQLSLLIGLLLVGLAAILLIAATRLPLATELLQVAMILLGLFSMAGVSILVKWIEGSPVAPFAVITFDENHTRSVLEKVIDVQVANQSNESTTSSPWEPTSDRLLLEDPNLALAKLRIDLERALRRVAHHHDISIDLKRSPIHRLLEALVRKKIVEPPIAAAIYDVLPVCNQAVHGADVPPDVLLSVLGVGADILKVLHHRAHALPSG